MNFPLRSFLWILILSLAICPDVMAVRLKIATISPEGSFWMQKMREGAEEVKKQTDGRVKVKYYPGGVMGDDTAVMRKIRIGQLQGGAFVAGSLANAYPDIKVYGLPMVFNSFEEIDSVRKKMDPQLIKGLEGDGFVACGIAEGGFAYFMTQTPVRSVRELQQRKMWVPNDDKSVQEGVKVFEMNAFPLSIADVRAGLQTGLIDSVATSPIGAVALQWHTQIKYVTDLPFLYVYAVLAIDKKAFDKIKKPDQEIVRKELGRVFYDIDRQNRKDNINAREAMKKQGIQFVVPTEEDRAEWKRRADLVPERLIKNGILSKEIMAELETQLKAYRETAK